MKKRIEFIDIAKGIAMFLVVWGHTASNAELESAACPLIPKILYSFHMPLFFFLSGLSISSSPLKGAHQWKDFLKKSVLTIAFPYFIWALIYSSFSYSSVVWIFYGTRYALKSISSLTSLWFLPCLFVSKIIVELVISYTDRKAWAPIAAVMLFIGIVLPKISIGYPWCLNIAFVASTCILLGVIQKKPCIELGVQKISLLLGLMALSIVIFAVSVILGGDNFTNMMMCEAEYGTGVGPLVRAVTGSFAVLAFSMVIRQLSEYLKNDGFIRVLIYIGQYTIGIFILHKPFMQEVVLPLMTSWTGEILSLQLIRFISAIIAMAATLPVCNLIMHYVPELIGVFSKERLKPSGSSAN